MIEDARTGERWPISGEVKQPRVGDPDTAVGPALRLELDALHAFTGELLKRVQYLEDRLDLPAAQRLAARVNTSRIPRRLEIEEDNGKEMGVSNDT